jgi:hypothetical protein
MRLGVLALEAVCSEPDTIRQLAEVTLKETILNKNLLGSFT